MNLFDYVKQHIRRKTEPFDLLVRPLEVGLPYYLGTWLFDEYFDEQRISELDGEYQAWHLEDLLALISYHDDESSSQSTFVEASDLVCQIGEAYEEDEMKYYALLDELRDAGEIVSVSSKLMDGFSAQLPVIRTDYCANYSDRVVHDRQLCAFISQLLLTIGFDGREAEGEDPKQWIERTAWPERVKAILRSRDRGACAQCGVNIVLEMDEESHIDHIVPLSRGGTNDIVNLQFLCAPCNLEKYATRVDVKSSVPEYLRRSRAT